MYDYDDKRRTIPIGAWLRRFSAILRRRSIVWARALPHTLQIDAPKSGFAKVQSLGEEKK